MNATCKFVTICKYVLKRDMNEVKLYLEHVPDFQNYKTGLFICPWLYNIYSGTKH